MLSQGLSRRTLLGAIAAAPAAAVPVIAVAAVSPAPRPAVADEDANLLALAGQIDPLLTTYRVAKERKREARAMAEAILPPLPNELVVDPRWERRLQWAGCTAREVDVEGNEIWPPDYVGADGKTYARTPREILKADLIKDAIARGNLLASRRTKHGKEVSRIIKIAESYEAARDAAIERSGIIKASEELSHSATDLEMLAYEVRKHQPVTRIGVAIIARVLSAHAEAELDAHGFKGRDGSVLGRELASAVLRLSDSGARS